MVAGGVELRAVYGWFMAMHRFGFELGLVVAAKWRLEASEGSEQATSE